MRNRRSLYTIPVSFIIRVLHLLIVFALISFNQQCLGQEVNAAFDGNLKKIDSIAIEWVESNDYDFHIITIDYTYVTQTAKVYYWNEDEDLKGVVFLLEQKKKKQKLKEKILEIDKTLQIQSKEMQFGKGVQSKSFAECENAYRFSHSYFKRIVILDRKNESLVSCLIYAPCIQELKENDQNPQLSYLLNRLGIKH